MTTEILELGEAFDARDLAKKARDTASLFDGGDLVGSEEEIILLALNAGLNNFLTGEYAAEEPKQGREGTDAVSAWAEFAADIAHSYERLCEEGYSVFHEEDNVAEVLKGQAEDSNLFKNVPSYIENAIDWHKVEQYITSTGALAEMFIDGETYVSNVYLSFD